MADKPGEMMTGKADAKSLVAGYAVHLLTASGAVVALLALAAIHSGDYSLAFRWMVVAMLIDSVDGTLARAARVKEVLPGLDGARLDDIVDYLNYVLVPMALTAAAGIVPPAVTLPVITTVLVASAYGFCQSDAKTPAGYFKGFPSYWNVIVFYIYALRLPTWAAAGVFVIFAALVFVPTYYVYPSRAPRFQRLTIILGAAWALGTFAAVLQLPTPSRPLLLATLLYPAYYLALSFHLSTSVHVSDNFPVAGSEGE